MSVLTTEELERRISNLEAENRQLRQDAQRSAQGHQEPICRVVEVTRAGGHAETESGDWVWQEGKYYHATVLASQEIKEGDALYKNAQQQPSKAVQQEPSGWFFQFNNGASSFVTDKQRADSILRRLEMNETCTEYFKQSVGINACERGTND